MEVVNISAHLCPSICLDAGQGASTANGLRGTTRWSVSRPLIVGRETADIVLPMRGVSRRHARIEPDEQGCFLTDTQSRNGTAVNGIMLDDETRKLNHGDKILIAGTVQLFYHDPDSTPVTQRLGSLDGIWIDPSTEIVYINAKPLEPSLSRKQFELLKLLMIANGSLVTKEAIISALWPSNWEGIVSNDAVDSLIKRLRRRLAEIDTEAAGIEIVRGRGIRIKTTE